VLSVFSVVFPPFPILVFFLACAPASAEVPPRSFGQLRNDEDRAAPIPWEAEGGTIEVRERSFVLGVKPNAEARFLSQVLPLRALRRYSVTVESRRGPGTGVQFTVCYRDANGRDCRRGLVFQLPGGPRPNWIGLAPYRRTYMQSFCLPAGAQDGFLEIALKGHRDAGFDTLELYRLTVVEGPTVNAEGRLGPNGSPPVEWSR